MTGRGTTSRLGILQIPIEIVQMRVAESVQLALVHLHYTSDAFLQSIFTLNNIFTFQHLRLAIQKEPGYVPT